MRKHEPSLYRHSLRVGRLATDYNRFVGMEYERGWNLIEGALLHDVGKICLPAAILLKPKQLTETEKRLLALHPTIGAELLEAQGFFGKMVLNIVRRHHERLDGSGYPDGWHRQRTAKVVRAVAVCDAICAMTEERPYEDAWPWNEALERLRSMPEQYDQQVVEVLTEMMVADVTSIELRVAAKTAREGRKNASGVVRPRSAFYAPRFRSGVRIVQ